MLDHRQINANIEKPVNILMDGFQSAPELPSGFVDISRSVAVHITELNINALVTCQRKWVLSSYIDVHDFVIHT
jgi:hypothetical protein